MKKGFILLGIMILFLSLTSCGVPASSVKNVAEFGSYKTYQWNGEISFPFPPPEAGDYEIMPNGTVNCYGVTRFELEDYLALMKDEGWEALDRDVKSIYYILIKDNMIILLIDQTMTSNMEIRIEFTKGYMPTVSDGRLGKKEAVELIQKYIGSISNEKEHAYGKTLYRLIELDVKDAYEKMGLQAFAVFDRKGQIANYLICSGAICDAWFLRDTMVVDIDKDDSYELLNICGWGSGIFRIEITAYKFGSRPGTTSKDKVLYPAYYNCYIPKAGHTELTLVKVSDTKVKLYGAKMEKGKLIPRTDYGTLKIDGSRLYTDALWFPFEEWN